MRKTMFILLSRVGFASWKWGVHEPNTGLSFAPVRGGDYGRQLTPNTLL
jgi:hypothetical protein